MKSSQVIKLCIMLLANAILAGCGGGSGDSTSKSSNVGVTPTNKTPTISVSESLVTLDEKTSATLSISTSDADGDSVTVTASDNSDAIEVSVSGNTLNITANEVATDANATVTLTASDGKGGSASTTVSITIINNSPSVSFDNGYLPIDEHTTARVALTITDPQNDITSVDVSTESELLSVSYDAQAEEIIIETSDVIETTSNHMVNILVTDAMGNTADANLNVTVVDVPVPNTSPSIEINTDTGIADYSVIDRTQFVVPFAASDAESIADNLDYEVIITDLNPIENFPYSFTYEFDKDNQLLIIQIPASEITDHNFSASIIVTDEGDLTDTAELTFTILKSTDMPQVTFENVPNIMFEGQTYEINYRVHSLDLTHYKFVSIDYTEFIPEEDKLLDFSLDETNQTLIITPKPGSEGKKINLEYLVTFRADGLTNMGRINLNVGSAWNEYQIALSEKVDELGRHLSQAMELEYAVKFMLEALLLNGTISQQEYLSRLSKLNKLERRYMNVEAAQHNYNYYRVTLQYSEYYADSQVAGNAINNLIPMTIRGFETTGATVVPVVNQYAAELGLGSVLIEDKAEYTLNTPERVSRFIGNTNYGNYQGQHWVFHEKFKWLDAITRKAYNDSL